ncbi:MAG: hypothetical protein JNM64_20775 [Chloroflexia bacterium]|nr:hypothetical protein [Chloroflexia bacterium]
MARPHKGRRAWLVTAGAGVVLLLGGCSVSPEATRTRGEPGGDVGNHNQPVQLLEPADRFERIFYDIPFKEPAVTTEDTAQQ